MNRIFGIVRVTLKAVSAAALTLVMMQQADAQSARVSVTLAATPASVAAGSTLTYLISVTNEGPDDAATLVLTDALPAGAGFVSLISPGGWACVLPAVGSNGTVSCSAPSMTASNAVFTVIINVSGSATPGGVIDNTVSVTSTTADPRPGDGVATARVVVVPASAPALPLSITPGSVPPGVVGAAYSQLFAASGGAVPYAFSNEVGRLPNVLTLTPGGLLSGTPQLATVPFEIWATDANGREARVIAATSVINTPLALGAALLPGTVGQPYSGAIAISGGAPPYACVVASGTLPLGVTLLANCTLGGTPVIAGTYRFTVQVTDGSIGNASQAVTLVVLGADIPVPALSSWLLVSLSLLLVLAGRISFSRKRTLNKG